jgi:hypothetical protein
VNESELSADDDEMFELEKHIAVALKERKEVKAAKKSNSLKINTNFLISNKIFFFFFFFEFHLSPSPNFLVVSVDI